MADLSLALKTAQAKLDFLQRQLFAINQATAAAIARGDTTAVEVLRSNFRSVAAQVAALKAEALAADMPSDFMLTLDRFGDEVVHVGKQLGEAAGNALDVLKYLPYIAVGLVVIVGLIYAGKIGKDLRK